MTFPAVCLSIGSSDSSGGAGIQGDLKTFTALSVHGLSVVTSVNAQGLAGVNDVMPVPEAHVRAQLEALETDFTLGAIKVGWCPTVGVMRVVGRWLRQHPRVAVIVDPVATDSRGIPQMTPEMVAALGEELLPRATVVTPNRFEAALFAGMEECLTREDMEQAATTLRDRHGCAVLVTGGSAGSEALDVLAAIDGLRHFSTPAHPRPKVHGQGSCHAAAIAAGLARGDGLREAIVAAKLYIAAAIASAPTTTTGRSVLWHAVTVREQVIAPPVKQH